jgi:hypothetical protein
MMELIREYNYDSESSFDFNERRLQIPEAR